MNDDISKEPRHQTTEPPTLGLASKRLIAMMIVVGLVVLYFGSFVLAEGDAYGTPGHPRDGYIHAPWFLGMPLAIALGFPATLLVARLWKVS